MTKAPEPRKPRIYSLDDPTVVTIAPAKEDVAQNPFPPGGGTSLASNRPTLSEIKSGASWGAVLVSAMVGIAMLAAGVWFARFVSVALSREDWVGWTATGLLGLAALAMSVIVGRELIGLVRLEKLSALRRDADAVLLKPDAKLESSVVARLRGLFSGRPECRWGLARLDEHMRDVNNAGDLLKLADRDLLAPLDQEARRLILASAKRVGMVTAMSPLMLIAVGYVLVENVRMLRAIAGLYGRRPGTTGALRLGRLVFKHLLASGGLALTDDLLGQFLGQDLLRRLSRRLGEGAFNGAMTARVGAAAIEVIRPLPYIEAQPVRVRDLLSELFRRTPAAAEHKL
ncbi:MAG: TIGR01620 family protein [Hyphomicrobium sp.]|nr:MAG: TIGR01620 family protein [Hyphomicrobium sp.]